MAALGGRTIGTSEEKIRKNLLRNHLVLSSFIPTNSLVKCLECELDAPDPGLSYGYQSSSDDDFPGDVQMQNPARLVKSQVVNKTGLSTLDVAIAASDCECGLQDSGCVC